MRAAFISTLEEISQRRDDVVVLTADLGFKLFDGIKSRCPERFCDVGIAEANMIGLAAGLALSDKTVYCYSIVPFLVLRALEQIKIDVAHHNLQVRLIGVGGGFTYGLEGVTHFGLEDLAVMRSLPNMTVVVPADPCEARVLAQLSYEHQGPLYIRLGRNGESLLHEHEPAFIIGRALILREGKDIALFAIGSMVKTGKQVARMLEQRGVSVSLYNMHTLKPLDRECICQAASAHERIASLEEHTIAGGLGSAVSEVLAEEGYRGRFRRIGIREHSMSCIGECDHLRSHHGLTPEGIYNTIMQEMEA